jgi:hypothetical protein
MQTYDLQNWLEEAVAYQKEHPSRELALAITKVQEACLWVFEGERKYYTGEPKS